MKRKHLLALLALLATAPLTARLSAAETATSRDNVNVRGQPSFVGEIITRLKKGEQVTVLEEITVEKPKPGEPAKWFKIGMPANTPVWVYSPFIDSTNKTVIPKRLNLRAGPGENYSVVGRLDHGALVKEIRSKGEWLEIEMPDNTYAFVAAELLQKKQSSPGSAKDEPAPTTKAPLSVSLTPAPAVKSGGEHFAVLTPAPPAEKDSGTPPTVALTESRLPPAPIEPLPELAAKQPNAEAPLAAQRHEVLTTSAGQPPIVLTPDPAPPPKRLVRREGIVGGTISIQAPAHFELDSPRTGEVMNYLHTSLTNLSLKKLKGQKILVTGEEYVDKRWPKTPVLEIESFEINPPE